MALNDSSTNPSPLTLSGPPWVGQFPASREVSDLTLDFRPKVVLFLKALADAKAQIKIVETFRPPQRAYLMHWSWMISKKHQDAQKIPPMPGVSINWWHGTQAASEQAAHTMVTAFGIDSGLGVAPALKSRHTVGAAIDMKIFWLGTLNVRQADGKTVAIPEALTCAPRDGTNLTLIHVAKTYQVIHFNHVQKDRNHWSDNGH